jgi:predicted ArsR family transcriptional regulator
LGRWLTRVIARGKTSQRALEGTGREIGRGLASGGGDTSPEQQLHAAFVSLGFQPRRELEPDGALTYRLCNCPYRDAASESQAVVCTLHRGITRGLLDAVAPTTKLTGFVPRDPYEAGCLVELRGPAVDEVMARNAASAAQD